MLTRAGGPVGDDPLRRGTAGVGATTLAAEGPVSELLHRFSALPTFVDTGAFEAVLSPDLTIQDRRTRTGAPVGSSQ